MRWLNDTPLAVVSAHVEMLGRLSAEEELTRVESAAVGRALKLGHWVTTHMARLRRAADGWTRRQAGPVDLSTVGIGVEVRKKK